MRPHRRAFAEPSLLLPANLQLIPLPITDSSYALAFYYGTTLLLQGRATSGQIVNVFFSILIVRPAEHPLSGTAPLVACGAVY